MKTILIDLDSTVANLTKSWLCLYNKLYNDNVTLKDIVKWDTHKFTPKAGRDLYKLLTPQLFQELDPYEGAIEGVNSILDLGHEVVFVTSAPKGTELAKIEWVENHFGWATRKDIIFASKKYLVVGDVFIDDAPHNIIQYRESHPRSIIYSIEHPYNKDIKRYTNLMAKDCFNTKEAWNQIYAEIKKLS